MVLKQKPSAKIKRRYILLKGTKKDIEQAILDYIGILGYANASPVFVSSMKKGLVLAVERKELDKVLASFAISADKIEVLKVSGTLKGLGVR